MKFHHVNRRTHLYLALALLPWMFMYGISSLPFSHGRLIGQLYEDGIPQWTETMRTVYTRDFPEGMDKNGATPSALQHRLGLTERDASQVLDSLVSAGWVVWPSKGVVMMSEQGLALLRRGHILSRRAGSLPGGL